MKKNIYKFYKKKKTDKIWWVDHYLKMRENQEITRDDLVIGELLISFDKKKIYNLWKDYPYKFTKEEQELFDKENSYWADYFKDRK